MNGKAGEEKGAPLIRTERNVEDLKIFKQEITNLIKTIQAENYYPNNNSCRFCAYTQYCMSRNDVLSKKQVEQAKKQLKKAAI